MRSLVSTLFLALALPACAQPADNSTKENSGNNTTESSAASGELKTAIFAGGCFWCVEQAFDAVPGVTETTSGYIGGEEQDPTYKQVASGQTGHTEALRLRYDPKQVDYERLLHVLWRNHDPTDVEGQFCDRGRSYRPGIFYLNEEQKELAEASKQALKTDSNAPSPIKTEINKAGTFYPAEDYHQNYHSKNSLRYKFYVNACGRYDTLDKLWGDAARPQIGG